MSDNKNQVTLEEIHQLRKRLEEINAMDVKTLQLTENGVEIEIKENVREDWKYTGLTTFHFLDCISRDKRILNSDSGVSR